MAEKKQKKQNRKPVTLHVIGGSNKAYAEMFRKGKTLYDNNGHPVGTIEQVSVMDFTEPTTPTTE